MVTTYRRRTTKTNISYLCLSKYDNYPRKYLFYILLDGQWGWLPYDIKPLEVLPFICEIPIRETFSILDNYRSIGIILPKAMPMIIRFF